MSTPKKTEEQTNKAPEDINKENINGNKPADLDKSPGDENNEKDPHRGITDTPSQHEQLLPESERESEYDDYDSSLDEELDDLDDIENEETEEEED